ncbi:MAG: hypothetical protein HY536_01935 [Candidatus Colwellbacteria bacterium]|nr:hypothetical protein [Candidatus Colwellbacteria bacterium]
MSRHQPAAAQVRALQKIFGDDVEVVVDPNPFDSADTIAQRFDQGGFDDLVVVAPLSVIDQLCKRNLKPLWSDSVEENNPRRIDFRGARGQGFRFVRFRRVKRIIMEFED